MLSVKRLFAKTKDKVILSDFNIEINDGEIHALMGPNGTGKSTLSNVIMGNKNYEITSGDIFFDGNRLNDMETDEIARIGVFLSFQNPISIDGVSNSEFLRTAINAKSETPIGLYDFIKQIDVTTKELDMKDDMIHRSVNKGASGGERKKNEVLQINLLKPKFIILDELDSGLDVDSLKKVCESINNYLSENPNTSVLIITHYPRILEYIKPNFVHVLSDGKIIKTSDHTLAKIIEKDGYSKINSISESTVCE